MAKLSTLIRRREPGSTWAYWLCLVLYTLYVLMVVEDTPLQSLVLDVHEWPLFLPAIVIAMQLAYPTLLGWMAVFLGLSFFLGTMLYYLILRWPPWRGGLSELVLGIIVIVVVAVPWVGLLQTRVWRQ